MAGLNKIMLIGHLGSDPEMRYTPSGAPVTSFRMATSRTYNAPDGERREETEWFTVVAWNRLAEHVNQFLAKGRQVYVEGRLRSRSFQGRDGQMHFINEVTANTILFLGQRGEEPAGPAQEGGEPAAAPQQGEGAGAEEDLPF